MSRWGGNNTNAEATRGIWNPKREARVYPPTPPEIGRAAVLEIIYADTIVKLRIENWGGGFKNGKGQECIRFMGVDCPIISKVKDYWDQNNDPSSYTPPLWLSIPLNSK